MCHPNYPSQQEIDRWCHELLAESTQAAFSAEISTESEPWPFTLGVRHHLGHAYVKFTTGDEIYYGLWQPASSRAKTPMKGSRSGASMMDAHMRIIGVAVIPVLVEPQLGDTHCLFQRLSAAGGHVAKNAIGQAAGFTSQRDDSVSGTGHPNNESIS